MISTIQNTERSNLQLQRHDVQNSSAKKTDSRPSLRGLQRRLGGGLSLPKPKLSYVPVTDTSEHIRLLPFSFSVFHFLVFGSMQ